MFNVAKLPRDINIFFSININIYTSRIIANNGIDIIFISQISRSAPISSKDEAHLTPVTVVVGGDVDTVAVVRNNLGVLPGVSLAAGGRHQLIMMIIMTIYCVSDPQYQ